MRFSKQGYWVSVLAIGSVLFPSIWFVDSIFAVAGGRPMKMIVWGLIMGFAVVVLGYQNWLKCRAKKPMGIAMFLALLAALYFAMWHWISPPMNNYNQAVSLCVLVPFSLYVGISRYGKGRAEVLAIAGSSVLILFIIGFLNGGVRFDDMSFQSLLPASTNEDGNNTGYQGLSLLAGFLPVYILARMANEQARVGWLSCLFLVSVLPVFYIGGRSALVALALSFGLWLFINGAGGRRQRLTVIALGAVVIAAGSVGYFYIDQLPLGLQRLIWLVESGDSDSSSRITLWSAAIRLWMETPMTIFVGHGPQQFPVLAGYHEAGMYPHNFVLELLSEYGLTGLFLFLGGGLYLIYDMRRYPHPRNAKKHAFYFFIYYTVAMMFMGGLQSIWPISFFIGWLWADKSARSHSSKPIPLGSS